MTLLKNGYNLYDQTIDFLNSSKSINIYCPYIKLYTLTELLKNNNSVKSVIVRWKAKDLICGSSDLNIFPYLKERGITLYRNPRLHLKAFVDNFERVLLGSANIPQRAFNYPEITNYNYELVCIVDNLTLLDKMYFYRIEAESMLITDEIYEQISSQLSQKKQESLKRTDFHINMKVSDKNFSISSLPMSYDVETLISVYLNEKDNKGEIVNCALHDLTLYKVPLGLEKEAFIQQIKISFFNHPFIRTFLENIDISGGIYFGQAKDWIQRNCTNVPTPRKWEITTNIQILYRWIAYLSDGIYQVDTPNFSERLYRKYDHL